MDPAALSALCVGLAQIGLAQAGLEQSSFGQVGFKTGAGMFARLSLVWLKSASTNLASLSHLDQTG
jgi:hypothetical protein